MAKAPILPSLSTAEKQFGYFRPGFYPIKSRTVVPAMVWLSDLPYSVEPDVHYIFVKPSCYLREWQDALLVSEKDFDAAMADCKTIDGNSEKISHLISHLTEKGYMPLQKIHADVQIKELH